MEGAPFLPSALTAAGITNHALLFKRALLAGLCFHAYQQVSYMILQRVSPVTHSIGNCVKRVVVIVASVFVFQNPVTKQNALGAAGVRARECDDVCGCVPLIHTLRPFALSSVCRHGHRARRRVWLLPGQAPDGEEEAGLGDGFSFERLSKCVGT